MQATQHILSLLPPSIRSAVEASGTLPRLREIRLRKGLPLSLTVGEGNLCIDARGRSCPPSHAVKAGESDLQFVLERAGEASLYRHAESLKKGYLTTSQGIRVGICGTGLYGGEHRLQTVNITSLNLRIPRNVRDCAGEALSYFACHPLASALFYAPPGGGKTTFIRDLALGFSEGRMGTAYRVAVVDEREELFPSGWEGSQGLLDVLQGYEKADAMECALRVLNPQILICDEIGAGDVSALLRYAGGGITVFATAHASTEEELRRRSPVGELLEKAYFPLLGRLEPGEGRRRLQLRELSP